MISTATNEYIARNEMSRFNCAVDILSPSDIDSVTRMLSNFTLVTKRVVIHFFPSLDPSSEKYVSHEDMVTFLYFVFSYTHTMRMRILSALPISIVFETKSADGLLKFLKEHEGSSPYIIITKFDWNEIGDELLAEINKYKQKNYIFDFAGFERHLEKKRSPSKPEEPQKATLH